MDAGPTSTSRQPPSPWRPKGCTHVAMVLQGGGALGAYQAGAYEALHEAGLEPDWIAGVSIGGINGAIIAGNPPERRLERLRTFWNTVTARAITPVLGDGEVPRRIHNAWSAWLGVLLGQPGFFAPNVPNPWLSFAGAQTATSLYGTADLRTTLLDLIDFKRLNRSEMRYAAGAVNVVTGNFQYFDNTEMEILPEHVMASGALPPGLPMVQVGTDYFWDGGLVSNTPLIHLLTNVGAENLLIFQVDLFSSRGDLPRDMWDVLAREKEIRYASRTRAVMNNYEKLYAKDMLLKRILDKVPDAMLTREEKDLKMRVSDLPEVTILNLIYQKTKYESMANDFEFSALSMKDHWRSGYRDTALTIKRKDWLRMDRPAAGVVTHDIHRPNETARYGNAALAHNEDVANTLP